MKISIFGMGYVGAVSGACLARQGHQVVGVDTNPGKVGLINAGDSPIVEEGMAELMKDVVGSGAFRATTDAEEAILGTELSFVSVGTPSEANGALSLRAVEAVSREIGEVLAKKNGRHDVVYRSTILPGTTEDLLIPTLCEASGRRIGPEMQVAFNPEFLREGSSIRDFLRPPFTILGTTDDDATANLDGIYTGVDAEIIRCSIRIAESVKYLCNIYHGLKVCFANEVGSLLREVGVDSREAMEIFCKDEILNISKAYLRPGFSFGGSCLPKDTRAFLHLAKSHDVELPMLSNVLPSNQIHVDRAYKMVSRQGRRKVALLGLAFKGGTDDLRESPIVALAEKLIGKGYELKIHDTNVHTARLVGSNKEFIEREIPHIDGLLVSSAREALEGAELVVVANATDDDLEVLAESARDLPIVDLQGVERLRELAGSEYQGIAW